MIPLRYFVKRFATFLITVWIALTVVFILPRLIPGDPIQDILMRMEQQGLVMEGGDKIVAEYRKKFGLEGDWKTQYFNYLSRILQGDMGPSIMSFPVTVQQLISERIPWTFGLLLTSIIISWTLGNVLGAILGWVGRESKLTFAFVGLCLFFNQMPFYILAMVLVLLLAYIIPIFPPFGAYSMGVTVGLNLRFIVDVLHHSFLPAMSIILVSLGGWAVGMRAMMVNIQGEDYILFAEAKGLRRNYIMMKYALRNAMLPQVTGLAMSLGFTLSGSFLVEYIYSYPGIGYLFVQATSAVDYNVMQGILLLVIMSVLLANLIIDLVYPLVDPRIRYEMR